MMRRFLFSTGVALVFLVGVGPTRTSATPKPTPVIDVTPDSDLSDGQTVQVSGTGFQEQQIQIAECGDGDLSAHPAVGPVCTYFTYAVDVQSDAEGNFGPVAFTVAKAFTGTRYVNGNHPVPTSYDCAPLNDCYIRAVSLTRGYRAATHSLTFLP